MQINDILIEDYLIIMSPVWL